MKATCIKDKTFSWEDFMANINPLIRETKKQPPEVFYKKGALKNFAFFKNTSFTEQLWVNAFQCSAAFIALE